MFLQIGEELKGLRSPLSLSSKRVKRFVRFGLSLTFLAWCGLPECLLVVQAEGWSAVHPLAPHGTGASKSSGPEGRPLRPAGPHREERRRQRKPKQRCHHLVVDCRYGRARPVTEERERTHQNCLTDEGEICGHYEVNCPFNK